MTSQLPPGCDSILSIDTNDVGTETIITITFCSGAIQQFSIPHGTDGADGASGGGGDTGADGNGIEDISVAQDGTSVTLTVTLNNGEEVNVTFEVPTAAGAYIVEHHSQGVASPELSGDFADKVVTSINGNFSVIKGTIPGNTLINAGDTLHWDAVFNVSATGQTRVHDVFKELYLCLGTTGSIEDRVSNINGQPAFIQVNPGATVSVHFNAELGRTNSPTREEVYLKGTMSIYDKGESIQHSHGITDADAPSQMIGTIGLYVQVPYDFSEQHIIQLLGQPAGFGSDNIVMTIRPIYMTVTKIPKI